MKCPRDQAPFEHTTVNGSQVYRCPECQGLWLPGSTIDPLLGQGEMLKLRSLCSAKESDLLCPFDGTRLGEAKMVGVTVDLCLKCNSLWLDWGELQLLQKRRKMTEPSSPSTGSGAVDVAQDAVDAASIIAIIGLIS